MIIIAENGSYLVPPCSLHQSSLIDHSVGKLSQDMVTAPLPLSLSNIVIVLNLLIIIIVSLK